MSKDPAVLFYTSDMLTGMTLFNWEQRGQYITLLCQQHQLGHLPENHMISICLSLDSPVIKKFKVDSDGLYYNERMDLEIEKRINYCNSKSHPGKAGRPKKSYDNSYDISYGNHTENDNVNKDLDVSLSQNHLEVVYGGTNNTIGQHIRALLKTKYPAKGRIGIDRASAIISQDVRSTGGLHELSRALDNYSASERVTKGYVKELLNWAETWKDWIHYETLPSEPAEPTPEQRKIMADKKRAEIKARVKK